jgi:hypothetical protein
MVGGPLLCAIPNIDTALGVVGGGENDCRIVAIVVDFQQPYYPSCGLSIWPCDLTSIALVLSPLILIIRMMP